MRNDRVTPTFRSAVHEERAKIPICLGSYQLRTSFYTTATPTKYEFSLMICVASGFGPIRFRQASTEMASLLYEDPRLVGLATHVAGWTIVWTAILFFVPPGKSGRNHIVSLNAAHGVVCTLVSISTIKFGLDTTTSTAVSLAFFIVDLLAMVNADGISKLLTVNRSRQMDYVHHLLGIFWGGLFFLREATVCDPALGNPYVWIQTNEISTPFYNWFRLTNSTVAGALFASLFFLSRVAFNSVYLIPRILDECNTWYLAGCVPYFLLQYVWFYMIVQKMLRVAKPRRSDTKHD